ncbi:hypothetical protein [Isoptericola sp. 178]|uniref:hypothetical protein n=1 Tax=Isoptericola sp. 178 TaxID=3064651 RepID=UPI002712EE37|nr:hypothetical protein [Isoptericola sp. 178]MDO8143854.1 hypothetical protein [Isoptericola sp. 178]
MATAGAVTMGLALTSGAAVVPAAVAVDGVTTIELDTDHAWFGQIADVPVTVTEGGAPAEGHVQLFVDGSRQVPLIELSGGRATLPLFTDLHTVGVHELEVRHLDPDATSECRCASSATTSVEILEPSAPLLTPASWIHGAPTTLRFDVTGTDLPTLGSVELQLHDSVAAQLVDGVADLEIAGDEVTGSMIVLVQRRADGEVLTRWRLPVDVLPAPVTVEAEIPGTWRRGEIVRIPVEVTSAYGTPTGAVSVALMDDGAGVPLTRESLVDGRAELAVDVADLPGGEQQIEVSVATGDGFESTRKQYTVDVLPAATRTVVSTASRWTYGTGRTVTVDVTSPAGTPEGRVVLYQAGTRIAGADLVQGHASADVRGKKVEPGRRTIVAKFVPATPDHAASRTSWTQRVRKAQPTVRLRMKRTAYLAYADLTGGKPGRIVVRTTGVPEVGKLVLQTRDPAAKNDGWRSRKSWWLSRSEDGVQRIKVPGRYLDKVGGRTGRVYLRIRYIPADSEHVAKRRSPRVTIYHL